MTGSRRARPTVGCSTSTPRTSPTRTRGSTALPSQDVRVPATAAFLDALEHAESLHLDRVPADRQRIDAFSRAARTLHTAWADADAHARTVAARTFDDADRTRLRRAAAALRTALDEAATDHERSAASAALARLTDGLVPVPDRIRSATTTALTSTDRRALPVGTGR